MKVIDSEGAVVDLNEIIDISVGNAESFVKTKNGKVYGCGLNTSGDIGIGSNASPIKILTEVLDNTGENSISNVVTFTNGCANSSNSGFILGSGEVLISGKGENGALGNSEYLDTYIPVIAGNNELKANEKYVTLKINETNQVRLNIEQKFNVYDIEKNLSKNVTYETSNEDIAEVSSTGLIKGKKIGKARIKITDVENQLEEYVIVSVVDSYGKTTAKVESGLNFTVALKENGEVWSFGVGTSGRLGNGSTSNQTEAVQVLMPDGKKKVTNAVDIAAGYDSASALLEDGTVISWGNNGSYNLGDGTNVDHSVPVYVLDSEGNKLQNIRKITRGNDFLLALSNNGEVYSLGYNNHGQLGIGNTSTMTYALNVKDVTGKGILKNIIDIGTTMYTSYAITENGDLYSWGYGANGELADGGTRG